MLAKQSHPKTEWLQVGFDSLPSLSSKPQNMSYKVTYKGIDADQIDWELEFKLNKVSNNRIEIPKGQRDIIKKALNFYISSVENIGCALGDNEEVHYTIFDMRQLKGMMDYPIHVDISEDEQILFTNKYGVDFPEY